MFFFRVFLIKKEEKMKKFFKTALLTIFAIMPFMVFAGLKKYNRMLTTPVNRKSEEWEDYPLYAS